ncbi:ATP-binding protein [Desulfosarcina cetonica]|uniref:ATP-binding protein n=1 Tax=Desulfosarcina cetonica TaxID=90730 RepID=UPI00278BBB7C|nr:ATP-binding protein [Desulfosarcina cetonica]
MPFSSLIDPEDRQAVMGVQHPVNRKSPPSYPTVRAHTKRGERCWLQMHSVPIDWEGKPAELCLMRDVTTSKRMEAQLYQAQKIQAIGTLAGGVAHDFNNILAAILGNTELCKLKIAPENGLNHNLDQIFSAGQRAKALINQILTFSRQKEKDQQPIEIRYGIKEALKLLQATLPSTIEIRDNIHKQPSIVVADQTQIHQIVMNVCTNAAHAMQERGGILKIGLTNIDLTAPLAGTVAKLEPGAYAVITVTDNGIGMSPETRECIFDPYFTTKPQGKGTGLGLSMVHGIVRALGGSINVHSEPGVGSTFEIYLPRTGQPSVVAVSAQQPIPGGHERILLVDDEAMLVDMTSELLLQLGYQVVGRTSSLEALQVFRTDPQHFDLVVTDQTMPNMTGKELASRVMATRPDLPVVICTGFSQAIDEEEALSLGIRAFVKKPILRNELAAAVRFALDGCCEAVRAQA